MNAFVKRPDATCNPAEGLLRCDHFQIAYATNDIDRACDVFRDRFGIREFRRLEGQLPAGGKIRIELAWVGTVMYELLTASGPGSEVWTDRLPADRFAIQHHHLGYLVHDAAQWEALLEAVERSGYVLRDKQNTAGFLQHILVEVPDLGHILEYIFPEPAGIAFFEGVPSN